MEIPTIERRGIVPMTDAMSNQPDATRIVQQGMQLQANVGTIGAVEFLKTHKISGAVIHRVLSSEHVRDEDRDVLNQRFMDEHLRP